MYNKFERGKLERSWTRARSAQATRGPGDVRASYVYIYIYIYILYIYIYIMYLSLSLYLYTHIYIYMCVY